MAVLDEKSRVGVQGFGCRVQSSEFRGVAVHDELSHGFADLQRDLFQCVPG